VVRERCRDGQRLRCRPVLHPSFAAGWLGARDRRGGIIVQAGRQAQAASSKRRMVGAMAHTNRQMDRRLVGNVVQVVCRAATEESDYCARQRDSRARRLSQRPGCKAKGKGKGRAGVGACLLLAGLALSGAPVAACAWELWRGTSVLDCRSASLRASESLLAALPSTRA
jgi:hypothetical protein